MFSTTFSRIRRSDVSKGLHDVAIGQTGGAYLLEIGIADFATLHDDAARGFRIASVLAVPAVA
jgi:hypothetical protein